MDIRYVWVMWNVLFGKEKCTNEVEKERTKDCVNESGRKRMERTRE
jgi:hypothetical protein